MDRNCPDEPLNLVCEIVDLYHDARIPFYRHEKVERGESRAVFAQTEDLFACYFGRAFSNQVDKVLVNQNLIFKDPKLRNRKPDITLLKDGEARVFMDLKMDLGFKRDQFGDAFRDTAEWVKQAREAKAFHYFAKNTGEAKISGSVAQNAVWLYIVISDSNLGKAGANTLNQRNDGVDQVETHVILKGFHPNAYKATKALALEHPDLELTPKKTLERDQVKEILKSKHANAIQETFEALSKTISDALDNRQLDAVRS